MVPTDSGPLPKRVSFLLSLPYPIHVSCFGYIFSRTLKNLKVLNSEEVLKNLEFLPKS